MNYNKEYYNKNKKKWTEKYNKTEYTNTLKRKKRNKKFMWVIEIDGVKLKFGSFGDIKKYIKREAFDFERDFNDLIKV